jgi:hypothetical protein
MDIKLSTGKLCPRCGCESLEECFPMPYSTKMPTGISFWDKHYHCVALCGMSFGLKRVKEGKIKIGFSGEENWTYLKKRFDIKIKEDDR